MNFVTKSKYTKIVFIILILNITIYFVQFKLHTFMYALHTVVVLATPAKGNIIIGKKEVTTKGIHSVTQYTAIIRSV